MAVRNPNRFALLMCCDYPGTPVRLTGCVNDGNNVYNLLTRKRGFHPSNVTRLYDRSMTRGNMIYQLNMFAAKTRVIGNRGQTPQCVLYYSGHGIRVPLSYKGKGIKVSELFERNANRFLEDADGNEALVPYDYRRNGLLLDDTLFSTFIKNLHPSTELFIMTDCCNSGSNFDLKYQNLVDMYANNNVEPKIIQLAGCQDDQYAMEVNGQGVLTSRFVNIMNTNPNQITNIDSLMNAFKDLSMFGNVQHPQVSLSNVSMLNSNLFSWLRIPN